MHQAGVAEETRDVLVFHGYSRTKEANRQALTALWNGRLEDPDLMTAPVSRQIAVSELPTSSDSSRVVFSSRPFTLLTIPYNSTNDFGRRIRLNVGVSAKREK